MSVEEFSKKVSDQKFFIKQMKLDMEFFDKTLLGRCHRLINRKDWLSVLDFEEQKLAKLRAELSAARGK